VDFTRVDYGVEKVCINTRIQSLSDVRVVHGESHSLVGMLPIEDHLYLTLNVVAKDYSLGLSSRTGVRSGSNQGEV
jgi:hypothetical protein